MKTTFTFAFTLSCRPFCLPTIETHVEITEETDELAPAEVEQQTD